MPARSIAWPSPSADGPEVEPHKPWFAPGLTLSVSSAAADFLDTLLDEYDNERLPLETALFAEVQLLIYGWAEIDSISQSRQRLHAFWTTVFEMTRSPPS